MSYGNANLVLAWRAPAVGAAIPAKLILEATSVPTGNGNPLDTAVPWATRTGRPVPTETAVPVPLGTTPPVTGSGGGHP
jgi:hypothetical protein